MLDAHYNEKINIAEYWAVGDTRAITLSTAESVDLVIIGMNHDDMADGSGKAAVTVQTKNTLNSVGRMDKGYGRDNTLWSTSTMRTYCNGSFKLTIPDWLQSLVKSVTKITNRHGGISTSSYRGQTSTTDDVFLLSEFETFGYAPYNGTSYGDVGSDGEQYEYMKTGANRIKSGKARWWTRSSYIHNNGEAYFIYVSSTDGSAGRDYATAQWGIVPAFCL